VTRGELAAAANAVAEPPTLRRLAHASAPHLTADASRDTLVDWLTWNDRNGEFDDLTHDEAWELLAQVVEDAS
jgi:hypothetical protein